MMIWRCVVLPSVDFMLAKNLSSWRVKRMLVPARDKETPSKSPTTLSGEASCVIEQ